MATKAPSTMKPSAKRSDAVHFNGTGTGAEVSKTEIRSGVELRPTSSARNTEQARINKRTTLPTTAWTERLAKPSLDCKRIALTENNIP